MGKKKVKKYGDEIIRIVAKYQHENKNAETDEQPAENKMEQSLPLSSKEISLKLFKEGKTIQEISQITNLAISTIEGHLSYFVGKGILKASQFVTEDKIEKIRQFFSTHNTDKLSEAKSYLGEDYSYSEIRFVVEQIRFEKSIED